MTESAYTKPDADVVRYACKRHGINYRNHVTMLDKLKLKEVTGISITNIVKSLAIIRKSFR